MSTPKKRKSAPRAGSVAGRMLQDESFLKDKDTIEAVVTEMIGFAEQDHNHADMEVSYGEAIYNLLKLPIESQKVIVWAIADRNKVKRPEYPPEDEARGRGRPQTGRKQLAEAQYGKWPDMLTIEGQNKDTTAGMRITDHKRRYMIREGLITPTVASSSGQVSRRVLRKSFEAVWNVLKNKKEREFVAELFMRLGVEQQDLVEWEEEASETIAVA